MRSTVLLLLAASAPSLARAQEVEFDVHLLGRIEGTSYDAALSPRLAGIGLMRNPSRAIIVIVDDPKSNKEEAPIVKIGVLTRDEIAGALQAIRKAEAEAGVQTKRGQLKRFPFQSKNMFRLDAYAFEAKVAGIITVGHERRKMVIDPPNLAKLKALLIEGRTLGDKYPNGAVPAPPKRG